MDLESIINLVKQNQFIAGSVSFWALGVFGDILKTVPLRIFSFFKTQFTTTVAISNYDKSYFIFLAWFEKNKYKKYSRVLKLNNGKWGHEAETTISAGEGTHFFIHNGVFFYFSLTSNKDANSERNKETINLTYLGRNGDTVDSLMKSILPVKEVQDNTKVMVYGDFWVNLTETPKRNLSTVALNSDVKTKLLNHISNFLNNKDFYLKHGIPYRTCILLYGPPGTGKTSIIKAIAAEYNKNISLLDIDKTPPEKIRNALCQASADSIIAVEDIDSLSSIHDRSSDRLKLETGISTILNAFDGIGSFENKIVILTTNHIEKIDPAMLRPGRIDLTLEVGKLDSDSIKNHLKNYFDDVNLTDFNFSEIEGCRLQQLILKYKSLEDVLNNLYRS